MNVEIVMQHGWGYDSSVFRSWVQSLEERPWPRNYEIKLTLLDRGYFGAPVSLQYTSPANSDRYSDQQKSEKLQIVVAHSLGLHLLPHSVLKQADYLISICSFLNFHTDALGGERRSRLLVGRMLTRLKRAPLEVLTDFYKITDPGQRFRFSPAEIDIERLRKDLLLLDSLDLAKSESDKTLGSALLTTNAQAIVIHGLGDTLVSEQQSLSLARYLNADTMICRAGHDLPFTHKNECVELIAKIVLARKELRSMSCA